MMMIAHWVNSVPFRQRLILFLVMIGLILSGFYTLIWEPTSKEIEALHVNVNYLEQEIIRQKDNAVKRTAFETDEQYARVSMASAREAGDVGIDPHLLRKEVQTIAQHHGLSMALWQPMTTNLSHTTDHTVSVQGRVEGRYHEIAKCFEAILKKPWAREVNQLRLSVANDGRVLSADFQLRVIVFSTFDDPQKPVPY